MKQNIVRNRIFYCLIIFVIYFSLYLTLFVYSNNIPNILDAKPSQNYAATKLDNLKEWESSVSIHITEGNANYQTLSNEECLKTITVDGLKFHKLLARSIKLDDDEFLRSIYNSRKSSFVNIKVGPPCDNDNLALYFCQTFGSRRSLESGSRKFYFESNSYFIILQASSLNRDYYFYPEYMIEKKTGLVKSVMFNFY